MADRKPKVPALTTPLENDVVIPNDFRSKYFPIQKAYEYQPEKLRTYLHNYLIQAYLNDFQIESKYTSYETNTDKFKLQNKTHTYSISTQELEITLYELMTLSFDLINQVLIIMQLLFQRY